MQLTLYALRRRVTDTFWERRFGVATALTAPAPGPDSRVYVTLPYASIFKVLKRLALRSPDVFFDIGCGRGRVLLAATRFCPARIVGIELSAELADEARANARGLAGGSAVEVWNRAAQDCDLDQGTVYFFYNPFGPDTFRAVLSRLGRNLQQAPRAVRIAYVRTCHEDVFGEFPWLRRHESFAVPAWTARTMAVSIWHNTP